jgi:hypothetical protein
MVVMAAAVDVEEDTEKPRRRKNKNKNKTDKPKKVVDLSRPARRCEVGFVEVASDFCCPKDHPVLIDSTCYAHCDEGSDDMVLGAWVGCRDRCEGGYSSSTNECSNGILNRDRHDHTRDGIAPTPQKSVASLPSTTISACPHGYVRVKRQGSGKFKHGGCCPSDEPKLIYGRCYPGCEAGRDELVIGRFVACRAHCADGWAEHNNECAKDHEESTSRGDFPRESSAPVDRIVVPKPTAREDPNAGCTSGSVGSSKHYCCPTTHPVLKGLLCYKKCKTGFEEAGFGCRKICPPGWDQSTLQCAKKSKTFQRKGYERHPKPSKLRI